MAFVPGELVIITLIERKGRFWGGNNRLPKIIQLLCFQQIGELVIVTLIKNKGSFWGGNISSPQVSCFMAFVPGELVIITLIERKGRFWGGNNRLPRIIYITIIMFPANWWIGNYYNN